MSKVKWYGGLLLAVMASPGLCMESGGCLNVATQDRAPTGVTVSGPSTAHSGGMLVVHVDVAPGSSGLAIDVSMDGQDVTWFMVEVSEGNYIVFVKVPSGTDGGCIDVNASVGGQHSSTTTPVL